MHVKLKCQRYKALTGIAVGIKNKLEALQY
jgi:hypothetical protein